MRPSVHIDVEDFGYRAPNRASLLWRESSLTLNFLGSDEVLFTFRVAGLLKRLPECLPGDEDQLIRAVILHVPDGKLVQQAEWRMHDRGRYLWALRGGRFLVRQRDTLFTTDATLRLTPYLEADTPVRLVQLSPDRQVLLLETDLEKHGEAEHQKLIEEAKLTGGSAPAEDVQLTGLRIEDRAILMKNRARTVVNIPLLPDGYLETLASKKDHWLLRRVPLRGEPVVVADIESTCRPSEILPNEKTVFAITCPTAGGDHVVQGISLDGRKLWDYRWQADSIWPTFETAEDGGRTAFSTLRVGHPVSARDPIDAAEILGQRIIVLDVMTGEHIRIELPHSTISAGQNFGLSADGRRFGVVRDGAIDVYDIPSLTQKGPDAATRKDQNSHARKAPD